MKWHHVHFMDQVRMWWVRGSWTYDEDIWMDMYRENLEYALLRGVPVLALVQDRTNEWGFFGGAYLKDNQNLVAYPLGKLLLQRQKARDEKDYEKADRLRSIAESQGYVIVDHPERYLWHRPDCGPFFREPSSG